MSRGAAPQANTAAAGGAYAVSPHWKVRPEGSNWGEWGPQDRLGRLNLLTPERRRAAAAEVREGLAFCLSLPLDLGPGLNPSRFPPRISAALRDGRPRWNRCACEEWHGLTDVVCDDKVELYTQYSTQWDSFNHHGTLFDADGDGVPEVRYYNGFPGAEAVGQAHLGVEHMAATGVQGRGVMIDLLRHLGDAFQPVGYDALMRVLEADRVEVEAGDLVCVRTGFADQITGPSQARPGVDLDAYGATLDGRDERLLQWITDTGLAALISDNVAVESRSGKPPPGFEGSRMPLHEHCLFKLGVHLGEVWLLSPLAEWLHQHGRSRFLLTAPPLRLPGAVGSPVTPVGTV